MRYRWLAALALLSGCDPAPVNRMPESMAAHQPEAGRTELGKLFAQGHVRAATRADIDAYLAIARRAQPAGSPALFTPDLVPDRALVLLKPFKVTPQMGNMTARSIIVPAGVGKNDDPNPLFNYYYLETGRCSAIGSNCAGAPKWTPELEERARRLSGLEPKKDGMDSTEREDGNWAAPPEGTKSATRSSGSDDQSPW